MTKNILTHGLHKTCWLLLLTVLLFWSRSARLTGCRTILICKTLTWLCRLPTPNIPLGLTVTGAAFFRVCWSAGKAPFFCAGFSGDHFYYRYCCRALERLLWREAG